MEAYAKKVEELLYNLNNSFNMDEDNEIIKRKNDRKARKAFENGLWDRRLRNKAISRGNKTFRESVDYVIEQELRNSAFREKHQGEEKFCTYCKSCSHSFQDCRRRRPSQMTQSANESQLNRDVTCYRCGQKSHYAPNCQLNVEQSGSNDQRRFNQNSNTYKNSPLPNNPNRNSPQVNREANQNPRNLRMFKNEMTIEDIIDHEDNEINRQKN